MNKFRHVSFLFVLITLTGCGLTGLTGPGLQILFFGLLLALLANCRPLLPENRLDEFLLRHLLLRELTSSNSGSSGNTCKGTQDYAQSFDLSAVDPAAVGIGFTITGENAGDRFGGAVAGGGDFNGDGIGDIVVAAYQFNSNTGRVYVLFGVEGSGADINTAVLTTTTGITITGSALGDTLGKRAQALDFAGDVNGDGFDDVLIGAYESSGGGGASGGAFLVFGSASPADVSLSSYAATVAARFNGAGASYYAGYSVAGLGDVNGDGIDDFAIGHKYGTGDIGEVNIVFGTSSGFTSPVSTAAISGGAGFTITGESTFTYTGASVSPAGDVNRDGIEDLVVGSSAINGRGAVYVIYGQSGTRSTISLASLGGDGFKVSGVVGETYWGLSSAGGGDFNGDGVADFAAGTRYGSSNLGNTAVLFGDVGTTSLGSMPASKGFLLAGAAAGDYSGYDHALTGDVNGDGLDDLFIGAFRASNSASQSGSAYLVFGRSATPTGTDLSSYTGGTTGIRIDGSAASDRLGSSVASGDINGDGCADMIVGAKNASATYVIFGGLAE